MEQGKDRDGASDLLDLTRGHEKYRKTLFPTNAPKKGVRQIREGWRKNKRRLNMKGLTSQEGKVKGVKNGQNYNT